MLVFCGQRYVRKKLESVLLTGIAFYFSGDYLASISEFNKVERTMEFSSLPLESQAILYYKRAKALVSSNDQDGAERDIKKAIVLDANPEYGKFLVSFQPRKGGSE